MSVDGLITLRSSFGPEETMRRLETEVHVRAMTIFGHIDHAEGAAAAGLPLRPTDLLIFDAAKSGTPLMQSAQTIGIDLPLKALVWQDEAGNTYLSYNDPSHIGHRHGVGEAARPVISAMSAVLREMAETFTTIADRIASDCGRSCSSSRSAREYAAQNSLLSFFTTLLARLPLETHYSCLRYSSMS